jgi:hypothetical protein
MVSLIIFYGNEVLTEPGLPSIPFFGPIYIYIYIYILASAHTHVYEGVSIISDTGAAISTAIVVALCNNM